MKSKFRFIAAALAIMLCMMSPVCVHAKAVSPYRLSSFPAATTTSETTRHYLPRIADLNISHLWGEAVVSGILPVAKEFGNSLLEVTLNAKITEAYNNLLAKAGKTVRTINFSYDLVADGSYLSILIRCKSASTFSQESYACIVFNTATDKFLTINDVLGPNGTRLANSIIAETVKANPKKFNPTVAAITGTHNFYMTNDALVLVFDQFEIAPGAEGALGLPIALANVTELKLDKNDYYLSSVSRFGVKMIPVRLVAETFGYDVSWNSSTLTVELRRNGVFVTSFALGENGYTNGRAAQRRLETAPELLNNRTYVPISLFEDVLGILSHSDSNGNIVFTDYSASAK